MSMSNSSDSYSYTATLGSVMIIDSSYTDAGPKVINDQLPQLTFAAP